MRQELAVLRAVGETLRDADRHPTRRFLSSRDVRLVRRCWFTYIVLLLLAIVLGRAISILPAPVEQRHEQRVVRVERRGDRARVVDLHAADRELDHARVRAVDHASVVPEPSASSLLRRGSHAELEPRRPREDERGVFASLDSIERSRVSRRRRERVRRVIARRRQARAHPTLVGARRTNNEKRIVTSLPIQKKNPSRLASQPLIVVVVVVYHIASHP
mmetsp:Transcript_1682/g.6736  ORF Transcript_1682/g.6736 Transcript_1682/m.6736 type:complete len:218 (+) Transcript_1682:2484-3137(+)